MHRRKRALAVTECGDHQTISVMPGARHHFGRFRPDLIYIIKLMMRPAAGVCLGRRVLDFRNCGFSRDYL
jgi:hypothetical protein